MALFVVSDQLSVVSDLPIVIASDSEAISCLQDSMIQRAFGRSQK